MALKQITAADFNAAIKKLTTSDASVWWKTLGTTEEGTELCFVMGWNDGYDEEEDLYQKDGYTLCSKIGYKPSNLMVMDYTDFNMPYDKKTADVWDTDMSVGKGEVTDDAFDVKWYNDEAEAIWKKYGNPDKEGKTALDLMESKKKESKKPSCSMQKKKESLAKKSESKKSEGVYGTIRVDSEDIAIKVQESNVYPSSSGRSLSVEVPKVEAWFSTLSEFSDCIDGLAENCNGYPDISRDGSDILVQINAPKEDESDDYEVIVELRCSTEITSTSLEGVVDLLNHD